ncbi:ROK family protein [Sulfurihydrogenibium azorense]|uniref:ROK family protein n=1 Tax=Sulfurihydrogenibium azorense TaxID=309806 RepID=UPI0024092636|nr:ROK family protein [Sulfurihydrogenibium azorense]MDM7273577.1 ROK family protein [Sulfurihydrogenibium azorense]
MSRFLGVDIGGTFLKVAFKENGEIKTEKVAVKDIQKKDYFLKSLSQVIKKYNPHRIGIAIAGLVDKKTGLLTNSPNLKFLEGLNLKEFIEREFNVEVFVENDANVAAYGEYVYGNGKDSKVLVCLTLGTGLGGGLVIDGKIFSGVSGSAMEIGHITIEKDGFLCHCGRKGCLESYVSSYGLERLYCLISEDRKTSFDIINLAKQNDEKAVQTFEVFTDYLAIGIMSIAHIFNPDTVLLAGGIIENYPMVLTLTKSKVEKLVFPLPLRDLHIDTAKLGSWSGAYGALALAEVYSS